MLLSLAFLISLFVSHDKYNSLYICVVHHLKLTYIACAKLLNIHVAFELCFRNLYHKCILVLFGFAILRTSFTSTLDDSEKNKPHHRQKRLFWITNDGRIALPPGTVLSITPTLALPFVRYPPFGFLSNMSISLPFTSEFCLISLVELISLLKTFTFF